MPATAEGQQLGLFGPLKFEPPASQEGAEDDEDDEESDEEPELEEMETSRKRQVDRQHHAHSNGSPAKRPRLSNGYENGADSATTPMDIDHTDNNHAYPSPLEGEQAQSPAPRTDGPERGIQADKIQELGPETTFLRLADDASESSPAAHSDSPLILLGEWNPQDPSILAAAGTDALARVWTVSRGTFPDTTSSDHVHDISRPYKNLKEDDVPPDATVSALAWNWSGNAIALATQFANVSRTRISIWSVDATSIHHFDGVESPILKLRWSPNNDLILSVGPEGKGTLLTIFSAAEATSTSFSIPNHDVETAPLDASWTSETDFIICGGDLLQSLRYAGDSIVQTKAFDTEGVEGAFCQVQFDWRTKLVATSTDKGVIVVSIQTSDPIIHSRHGLCCTTMAPTRRYANTYGFLAVG